MPRYTPYRADGGRYVCKDDRKLPPADQVTFCHRDPLPSEVAEFEDGSGCLADGRWYSEGASVRIRALLRLTTDVQGPDGNGGRLEYPAPGKQIDDGQGGKRATTNLDRERFFAGFPQSSLIEVADAMLERRHISEEESGNSPAPPS